MRRFVLFIAVLVLFFYAPYVSAGDVISPPVLTYSVEPGESFEFDLSFLSEGGGEYDVILRQFSFDDQGVRTFEEGAGGVLQVESEILELTEGENVYIPVRIQIPEDAVDGDLMYQVGFRIRGNSFHSYELSSVVLLSVGAPGSIRGEIELAEVVMGEKEGEITGIDYVYQNNGGRYVVATPQLRLLRSGVEERYTGKAQVFFPVEQDSFRFSFFDADEILFDESVSEVTFRMISPEQELLGEYVFQDSIAGVLKSSEKVQSAANPFRERRRYSFLYNPIFKYFALFIGLTLVLGSLFMNRKES